MTAAAAISLAAAGDSGAAGLPRPVTAALKSAGIPMRSVSAIVQDVDARRPSLAFGADEAMNPASLMKLVTTYAALELLSPAYTWKTEAYAHGEMRGDTLVGDLVLRGSGDPRLDYEAFWMMLRALRGRGLRELRGDVVVDRSHFAPEAEERIDDESFRPYNVPPDALLVNYKSVRFVFLPDLLRNSVRVFGQPPIPGTEVENTLSIVERPCPEGRAFRDMVNAQFQSRPARAAFTGVYPASCGERDLNVALHTPNDYVAGMFRHLWEELGGRWTGAVREGTVPDAARLIHVHESRPLAELVRDINKFSNNVMARQLYLTLAAELGGTPALQENAEHALRQWLARKRIRAPGLSLDNGSGLSRTARISARTLGALLIDAWRSPVMPEFVSALPVSAVDGTMRKRLHDHPVAGNAHLKTGLLSDVRSIGGYVLDRRGRRRAVVMIVNHPKAHEAQAALDAFVEWAYAGR